MPLSGVLVSLCVAVVVIGCSQISGADDLSASDQSITASPAATYPSDASTTDATVIIEVSDASDASVATPGNGVECGQGTSCGGATPVCCAAFNSYVCVAKEADCVGGRYRLECDDRSDCASSQVCCSFEMESRCVATSACRGESRDELVMCLSHAECPSGQRCDGFLGDGSDKPYAIRAGLCMAP